MPHKTASTFVHCESGTWKLRTVAEGVSHPKIEPGGCLFFTRLSDEERLWWQVALPDGTPERIPVAGGVRSYTGMTIILGVTNCADARRGRAPVRQGAAVTPNRRAGLTPPEGRWLRKKRDLHA